MADAGRAPGGGNRARGVERAARPPWLAAIVADQVRELIITDRLALGEVRPQRGTFVFDCGATDDGTTGSPVRARPTPRKTLAGISIASHPWPVERPDPHARRNRRWHEPYPAKIEKERFLDV